jgi:RNA polymerase sigma-70 factor (ECF subfamily)
MMGANRLEAQFIRAYDELADAIFRYCFYRMYDRERARELTQETFTRAWSELVGGAEIRNLRAFLYRVAYHLIVDETRRKHSLPLEELRETGFEPAKDEAAQVERQAEIALLTEVLNQLDEEERDLIVLRHVNGISVKEIAETLGITPDAASVRIHRALKKFKTLLSDV